MSWLTSRARAQGSVERGHDIIVVNSKGEGVGRAEQCHDIVMGMNVKGAGGGRSVQGHDIVMKKNAKGAGGKYQNLEAARNQVQVQNNGKGRDADDGAAEAAERHHRQFRVKPL